MMLTAVAQRIGRFNLIRKPGRGAQALDGLFRQAGVDHHVHILSMIDPTLD